MAADNQMDPADLEAIAMPVVHGEVEYSKANRLFTGQAWDLIPHHRYLGNAVLSLLTKIASGYWHVADSQSGYTAAAHDTLAALDLDRLYPRYGFPNDMLVHLNVVNARVRDVPSRPVYGVGERSGIKLRKVVPRISWLLVKAFFWRLREKYVIRDFHPLVFFYVFGIVMGLAGLALGIALIVLRILGPLDHGGDRRPGRAAADLRLPVHALCHVVRHGVEQRPEVGGSGAVWREGHLACATRRRWRYVSRLSVSPCSFVRERSMVGRPEDGHACFSEHRLGPSSPATGSRRWSAAAGWASSTAPTISRSTATSR